MIFWTWNSIKYQLSVGRAVYSAAVGSAPTNWMYRYILKNSYRDWYITAHIDNMLSISSRVPYSIVLVSLEVSIRVVADLQVLGGQILFGILFQVVVCLIHVAVWWILHCYGWIAGIRGDVFKFRGCSYQRIGDEGIEDTVDILFC